jgi:hypothetical protein
MRYCHPNGRAAAARSQEAGIDFTRAARSLYCMYGPGHQATLEAEFAATASLGVTTSCTIQVEGARRCVRDGGQWLDEQCPGGATQRDFLNTLCEAYAAKNRGRLPPPCKHPFAEARAAAAVV